MCFDHDSQPPALPADRVLAPLAGGAGAEVLTLRSEDGTEFAAAFADTPSPSPVGVVIIPDIRGLYRFYSELAERFAEAGHAAIAFDPFGRTAGVGVREEEFEWLPHVQQTTIDPDPGGRRRVHGRAPRACGRAARGGRRVLLPAQAFHASTRDDIGLDAVVGFYGRVVARLGRPAGRR